MRARGRPFQHKLTTEELGVPDGGWISIGDAQLTPDSAEGECGEARWSLRFASAEPELRHLPRAWMYRAPLPRTKLTSPAPAASFEGTIELPDPPGVDAHIELRDWHGMVGHNWGAEHAERWIWLHGIDFEEDPDGVARRGDRPRTHRSPGDALGGQRRAVARRTAPAPRRPGRAAACWWPRPRSAAASRCRALTAMTVDAHIDTPADSHAGWRYADPDGGEHDVSNCSIAALAMTVRRPGYPARTLHTAHGAAYELGMREHDHGVPIAPFADG